jgi:hypothetical protein
MVKYPLQSMVGGTLLLTVAFSLNDGPPAKSETNLQNIRLACDSLPDRHGPEREFADATPVQRCMQDKSKK